VEIHKQSASAGTVCKAFSDRTLTSRPHKQHKPEQLSTEEAAMTFAVSHRPGRYHGMWHGV